MSAPCLMMEAMRAAARATGQTEAMTCADDSRTTRRRTGDRRVAPVGHPAPLPTFIDSALQAYDVVWAA
ncbi:hypothetical protein CTI14_46015, partial [Methylobacterium radiotolerans]